MRVRFSGWAAVAAVKRELRIPLTAIRAVSAGPFRERPWRLLGTSEPISKSRYGRFRRHGQRFFLALRGEQPTLLLELDRERAGYDAVAVSLSDADRLATEIEASLR